MNVNSFDTPQALAEYVTDQAIVQANIVQIVQRSGRWYLFWYSP